MKKIALGISLIAIGCVQANATKSATDCENEIGPEAKVDHNLVVQCLWKSVFTSYTPPDSPAPIQKASTAKSVEDCEREIGEPAQLNRDLVAKCLQESLGLDTSNGANTNTSIDPRVYVLDFGIEKVNSANGVEPYAVFINPNKGSPIKYIRLMMTLYNAVGDKIGSSIGNAPTRLLSFTGPLHHDEGRRVAGWQPVWYNSTGACVSIQSLSVEWMNGKKISLSGKELRYAIAADVSNSCRVK